MTGAVDKAIAHEKDLITGLMTGNKSVNEVVYPVHHLSASVPVRGGRRQLRAAANCAVKYDRPSRLPLLVKR